jgi:flap endonuclease-1
MGIPKLNRFLVEKCNDAISKKHLSELSGEKIAIDTSIYLYKYIGQDKLIENFYLMIQIFKYYKITPIFIFDGKPPPEKRELINMRKISKKEAEMQYNEIKMKLESNNISEIDKSEFNLQLIKLKKQFIRPKKCDIDNIKSLISHSGLQYCEANGEADELCASMILSNQVDACMSDDMDLFVYGCNKIYRYLSLLNHDIISYDMNLILQKLKISLDEFKQIMVLSGTDYNIHQKVSIVQSINYYNEYKKSKREHSFFKWLIYKNIINNDNDINNAYMLFNIQCNIPVNCFQSKENKSNLIEFLKPHGFIFI